MSQIARLGGVSQVEPKIREDAMADTIKKRPAQQTPPDAARARSRAAREIVVDVLASALWTILRAETATTTSVPTAMPSRPLRPVPTVSQPAGFSAS